MINLGIIGIGGWGKNLLRTFSGLPGVRVKIACDLVAERIQAGRERFPTTDFSDDYRRILKDPEIRAVVVATPGAKHFKPARECLEAGKDVFIEKPMTLTARDSRELVELADRKKLIVMVGHLLLYHPAVRQLKSEVKAGTVGRLYYLYSQRLNLGKIRRSENALWTFAPHDISVALYLVGKKPISVSAWGESYIQKGVVDVAFVRISFADRGMAQIHVSWLDPHKVRRITLVGSKKMIVFDDMNSAEPVKIYDKGVPENLEYDSYGEYLHLRYGDVRIPWVKSGEPLQAECAHFIDCVRERKTPLTDGMNGLTVVKVLESAQKSMEAGGSEIKL